jgi:ParB/RepB/Spo0J family partition protein
MNAPETNGAAPLVQMVPLKEIVRSPWNRNIDTKDPKFSELVESIRIHGVIQPGLARPLPGALDAARKPGTPRIELVIGERRWLGSAAAGKPTMPLIVRQMTDTEALELQAIENEQREDLSPIERAEKYQQLLDQYEKAGLNKEAAVAELCKKLSIGKKKEIGKSTVYEALRLLKLSEPVKEAIGTGKLPPSHAGLIAKLPEAIQPLFAKAIAPGEKQSWQADQKLEEELGIDIDGERDEETGLMSFRDAKDMVDAGLRDLKRVAAYDKKAVEFVVKGGTALTWVEARKESKDLLTANEYLAAFNGTVSQLIKGVKDLPKQIMRPKLHDPAVPEMVYRRTELEAALKKAGVKKRVEAPRGNSMAAYEKRQRVAAANERRRKAIVAEVTAPIRQAAGKRNAKVPWSLFLRRLLGDWQAAKVNKALGWDGAWNDAAKTLGNKVAKLPENRIPGVLVDVLITKLIEDRAPKSELEELGKFYGVDVPALEKAAKAKLEPAKSKPKAEPKAAVVQTSGKQKGAKKAKRTGLTAAARKRLTEAMKARWAARRKAAAK